MAVTAVTAEERQWDCCCWGSGCWDKEHNKRSGPRDKNCMARGDGRATDSRVSLTHSLSVEAREEASDGRRSRSRVRLSALGASSFSDQSSLPHSLTHDQIIRGPPYPFALCLHSDSRIRFPDREAGNNAAAGRG